MGRGLGTIQKIVIDTLLDIPPSDVNQIAMVIYKSAERKPTKQETNSVRKTIKALAKRELIEQGPLLSPYGRPTWKLSAREPKPPRT
jgi:hypothetical protein